jgi:hypothetical protein
VELEGDFSFERDEEFVPFGMSLTVSLIPLT